MKRTFAVVSFILLGSIGFAFAQDAGNERSADRTLRGSGRVNASTLGMEFQLPLGAYPGRGINVPINLSYSSKVWRLDYTGHGNVPGASWSDCYAHYRAVFGEKSASGWTSSMAAPYIEYVGVSDHYTGTGIPYTDFSVGCPTSQTPNESYPYYYVRRILIHLPGGESHEVRPDDTLIESPPSGSTGSSPYNAANWDATYFAADGSNLKYIQNAATNTYRIQMPDGSFYDLDPTTGHGGIRKATKYTDRNGNFTTYHGPGSVDSNGVTHPNGFWRDTLGRNISIPLGLQPPGPTTVGNPQVYSMPGMTGTYKLHWKLLNGGTQAESAMTDISSPNYQLKYPGETYVCNNPFPTYCTRPASDTLFRANGTDFMMAHALFNPVVLTEIELPTGQKYKFTYDNYGRIEQIHYPTGGQETFTYTVVPTLSTLEPDSSSGQTNFGVTNRKVYRTAGDLSPYEWEYSATYVEPGGYKVTTNNPDGTRSERKLRRGNDACVGCESGTFGYDNPLAGMAYEETAYDNVNRMVSKKLTEWQPSNLQISILYGSNPNPFPAGNYAGWHPRVLQAESQIYDASSNGISATTTFEYEGDLNLRETSLLTKRSSQYAFVPVGGSLPPNPVRSSESTFLINDLNYAGVKANYTAQNMVGLVTASQMKDGAGVVVSRSETVYDESGRSPGYRGNPTTARAWDSTKGIVTNTSAYISTSARFDTYGNQYEATDAKGNTTTTTFDSTFQAFPIQVTSPIPDPSGLHGSNTAFVTGATFDYVTGLPLTTTDANGLETRIVYDPVTLRPINTKTYYNNVQVGSTAETIYHDEPNNHWVKSRAQIDANLWAESITYFDGLGRAWKSEEVNSKGNIFVEKEFDADGRVLRVSNPFRAGETKMWTTNVYDEASRVKEVILQDGSTVKTDYGVSLTSVIGVVVTTTDQANKQRRQIGNSLGQTIRVDEPNTSGALGTISLPTQPTHYYYNTNGQMVRVEQGFQSRYFMYDSLGRLLRVRQPEQTINASLTTTGNPDNNSWTAGFTYDDAGSVLTAKDARSVTINYGYDNLNRLKTRSYSDSTSSVAYKYDILPNANGKLIEVSSSVSTSKTAGIDNLGRPTSYQQITDGQTYTSTYEYGMTQLMKEVYPSGREVRYEFDSDGDLSRVWGLNGQMQRTYANSFAYNSAGAVERVKLGNGKWETAKFNDRLQISEIGLGNGATDTSLWKTKFEYGELQTNGTVDTSKNAGNIAKQTLTASGMVSPMVQTYEYDSLDRLTEAEEKSNGSQNWIQQYSYDRYGNRTSFSQMIGQVQQNQTPAVDVNTNRFSNGQGYVYDLNGNLIQDPEGRQFTFNGDNRQTEVRDSQNNVIGQYSYDGQGKRIKKFVPATGETTVFVYSGGKLVAEYSTNLAPIPTVSYTTSDQLGSPRVITDALGQVVSRRDFMPFGEELQAGIGGRTESLKYSVNGADNIRKRFTGYEKDAETGLDFAEARYYKNEHGRFTAVDPLLASGQSANPQTFNRYAYTTNNPVNFTDPSGLIPETTAACGSRCPNSGPFVDGSAFRGRDATFDWANSEMYYTVTRTSQYQTTAEDGNRRANITISVTESLVVDRHGNVIVGDSNPLVTTTATSVGTNPIAPAQLRSIENIVTTAVRLAIADRFSVPILLAILKTETQFGILPNHEGVRRKASEINPGQFSKSSGLGQAVDDQGDGYTTQQALEINIGKTMFKWNHESVQRGKTLNEQFQLYNSESRARRIAYANKAEATHNSIHASHRFVSSRTNGWFLSRGRPSSAPLIGVSACGVLSRCPNFKF